MTRLSSRIGLANADVSLRPAGVPVVKRTPAQIAALRHRHAINKQVFIKDMVRRRVLTEAEAARQYDEQHGRWT